MIIAVEPISVPHESILALHLHEQYLMAEYERIVKTADGTIINHSTSLDEALRVIKSRMKNCEKARDFLERNLLYLDDIKEVIA